MRCLLSLIRSIATSKDCGPLLPPEVASYCHSLQTGRGKGETSLHFPFSPLLPASFYSLLYFPLFFPIPAFSRFLLSPLIFIYSLLNTLAITNLTEVSLSFLTSALKSSFPCILCTYVDIFEPEAAVIQVFCHLKP